jgi:hypothetical protein
VDHDAELNWWLALAPTLNWTFAKTMKDAPHEYVVRDKTLADPDFERAVRVIRRYGEPGKFYARTNIYLVDPISGLRWWTMGAPLDKTIIINQAVASQTYGRQDAPSTANDPSPWDALAADWDVVNAYVEETDVVRRALTKRLGAYAPRMVDVGAGTGRVLDMAVTHPALYTAVDSSQAMLNELVRKTARQFKYVPRIIAGRIEDHLDEVGRPELTTMLFGAAEYVDFAAVETLVERSEIMAMMPLRGSEQASRIAALPGAETIPVNDQFDLTIVGG